MPTLLTLDDVKADIPEWNKYARFTTAEADAVIDARLTRAIEDAEVQMGEYVPGLTPETITPALERHLRIIVRKNVFDLKLGNAKFETKPQIVRDYEQTRDMLGHYKTGGFAALPAASGDEPDVKVERRRPRRFGTWFTRTDSFD